MDIVLFTQIWNIGKILGCGVGFISRALDLLSLHFWDI